MNLPLLVEEVKDKLFVEWMNIARIEQEVQITIRYTKLGRLWYGCDGKLIRIVDGKREVFMVDLTKEGDVK